MLHIALLNPEIPGNTGNIGRLAVGIDAHLHLIHPLGFDTSAKAVRRAGIDHWKHVRVTEHGSLDAFRDWAGARRIHLLSSRGERPYTAARFSDDDVLLFGPESAGLPAALIDELGALVIPMTGPIRSLNLANAVAVVCYEAMQQLHPQHFPRA